jgi:FkbM family methyltransferase
MRANASIRLGTARCGPFLYNPNDLYIGRAIELYGEAHELELEFLRSLCGAGSYVFDAGANIGDHTVPLAQHVGERGRVFAFEPQRVVFQMLCGNVALAGLVNVETYQAALGAELGSVVIPEIDYGHEANYGGVEVGQFASGRPVPVRTLDEFLDLPHVDLLKIDVEGMERAVLAGGARFIEAFRPLMYVENDRLERSAELIEHVLSLRYRLFWHLPPLFNPRNFRANSENVFGNIVAWNMLCVPAETPLEITGFQEITDARDRPFPT